MHRASNTEATFSHVREAPVLSVLTLLLDDFRRLRVSYCYWKSSRRLANALAGESDLDLLLASEDHSRAQAILLERGFKHFRSIASHDHPAITDYVGHDETSGRLVHVHLYLQLFIGEPLLKDYHIPWEGGLLGRAVWHSSLPIKLLDIRDEALLLAVRSCLEQVWLDPVAWRNRETTAGKFASDQTHLASQIEWKSLRDHAATLVPADLANAIADAYHPANPPPSFDRLRRRIKRHFAPNRMYNSFESRLRSVAASVSWGVGHLNKRYLSLPRPWKRRAPGGGCVIAIVGLDGSGKSTAVSTMRSWLSAEVDVVTLYFGTGEGRPSLLLLPFKLTLPFVQRRIITSKPKGASHGKISNAPPTLAYTILLTGWAILVAIEKKGKLLAARRGANRGMVVLTDRFPQNEFSSFNDGPLMPRLSGVPRGLRRFEENAYSLAQRLPPDLVIKLVVGPETTMRREPDMDRDVINDRIAILKQLRFPGAQVICINAEQPLAKVLSEVKREIWRRL